MNSITGRVVCQRSPRRTQPRAGRGKRRGATLDRRGPSARSGAIRTDAREKRGKKRADPGVGLELIILSLSDSPIGVVSDKHAHTHTLIAVLILSLALSCPRLVATDQ